MTAKETAGTAAGSFVTFINVFEIAPEHLDHFIARWEERAELMRTKPGFIDSRMHRARTSDQRFQLVNVAHWETQEDWEAATADPEFTGRTQAARSEGKAPAVPNTGLYDIAAEYVAEGREPA